MGSWCELTVDGFSVSGSKSYVDDIILSVFHERDRRVGPDPSNQEGEENNLRYEYATSAQAMRERLDTLGFTAKRARTDYAQGHAEYLEMVSDWDWQPQSEREQLRGKTYDYWCAAIRRLVPQGFQTWDEDKFSHDPDAALIAQHGEYGLGAHFSDLRLLLRGVLDALPEAREVALDYTHLVDGGYYAADERVCADARLRWAEDQPAYGPIVLLTEGRSDTRVLSAAIEAMAPHLADLFGFLDFEGLKLQGGADTLAKTVRAFVGARVSTRVVAIFDNDTAGAAAMASLADVRLPPNIRAIALPSSGVGSRYPTEGPQGVSPMDVNGMACSIELYLGQDAVSDGLGGLRPVRWTGWNPKMGRYQGEIEGKPQVEERFIATFSRCASPAEARSAFPDLARVVDKIAGVFADAHDTFKPVKRREF
jgi:hypothetical protein